MALIRANSGKSSEFTVATFRNALTLPVTEPCNKGDILTFWGSMGSVPSVTGGTVLGSDVQSGANRTLLTVRADIDGNVVIGGTGSVSGMLSHATTT